MRFSILHLSDLHRDLSDEIDTRWLVDSLARDIEQYTKQDPPILAPRLCIVSGDLVYGVDPSIGDSTIEMERQYAQADEFLAGLAERFFKGVRERIVLVPGNHDVNFCDVMGSVERIDIPIDQHGKRKLVTSLSKTKSTLRWSWKDLCFFRIVDDEKYLNRFRNFSAMYERFYNGQRKFSDIPEKQYSVHDFSDIGFSLVALNSCYNNDPLRRAGMFHPAALADACNLLRESGRAGWLTAAVWHHNLGGGPTRDDYLDSAFVQSLIDSGVSIGFHGHQHSSECLDERYRIGPSPRKITIVSAGTLCSDPHNLKPGVPRSFNVIELDANSWTGRVHQRHMVNDAFDMPIWGPGYFDATNKSYIDFALCKPLAGRPSNLDSQLALERADLLIGERKWLEGVDALSAIRDNPLARPLLMKALEELGDARKTITQLWPPRSITEAVVVGGALLEDGTSEEIEDFLRLGVVSDNMDASVREISRRLRERLLR
jgi:3',5'-cyclic AMP phosphodiesterase CpdA